MKTKQLVCTLVLVALPLAIGCGSSSTTATTSVLDGSWTRGCQTSSPPFGSSYQQQIVYGGGNYTYSYSVYSDAACATALFVYAETGTFVVGGADATTPAGTDVTYTQSAATGTTSNGEGATLTTAAPCGSGVSFTDGTATAVAGLSCSFFGSAITETANGSTIANLFSISGTTLTLGHTSGSEFLGNVAPAAAPTLLRGKTLTKE